MRAYLAERLPGRVFVPVAFAIACAAHAAAPARPTNIEHRPSNIEHRPTSPVAEIVMDAGVLLVILAQFRIWDDLADREIDAVAHPDRVLVRAPRLAVFRLACAGLAAAAGLTLATAYPARGGVSVLVACNLGAAAWYLLRGPRTTVGDHVLLAKYPAFVAVIAIARGVDRPGVLACSAAAIYFAASLYEAMHDPRSPAAGNVLLVSCEAVLLVVSSTAAAIGALV